MTNRSQGPTDMSGQPFHRRASEMKLQSIADNALFKVLQFVFTAILLPMSIWFANGILTRLDRLEDKLSIYERNWATAELRLQTLERAQNEVMSANRLMAEKLIIHDFELKALQRAK